MRTASDGRLGDVPVAETSGVNRLRMSLEGVGTLVMPNVWDPRSARVAVEAGHMVLGTSSSSIAETLGGVDGEGTSREEMLAWDRRIVAAVPSADVNVDLESGYGLSAVEIVEVVRELQCAGVNLEDTAHDGSDHPPLIDPAAQADRLYEVGAGLAGLPGRPVLTARVDSMLDVIHRDGLGDSSAADERVDDCIRRSLVYLDAGADLVFPIGLSTPRQFARFLTAVPPRRTSLLVPLADARLDIVRGFGVSRISTGGTSREAVDAQFRRHLDSVGPRPGTARRLRRAVGPLLGRSVLALGGALSRNPR